MKDNFEVEIEKLFFLLRLHFLASGIFMSEIQKPTTHCTFFIIKQTLRRIKNLLEKIRKQNFCEGEKINRKEKEKSIEQFCVCWQEEEMEGKNGT